MPTGYTVYIEKGCNFKEYALVCARAFGALLHMRDEPMDSSITLPKKENKEDSFYAKELSKTEAEYSEWKKSDKSERLKMLQIHFEKGIANANEQIAINEDIESKYDKMKEEVLAWIPPTEEHEGLKKFMLEQIETGRPGMSEYYRDQIKKLQDLTFRQWEKDKEDEFKRQLKYYSENLKKDNDRNEDKTKWITDLQKSLSDKDLVNQIDN